MPSAVATQGRPDAPPADLPRRDEGAGFVGDDGPAPSCPGGVRRRVDLPSSRVRRGAKPMAGQRRRGSGGIVQLVAGEGLRSSARRERERTRVKTTPRKTAGDSPAAHARAEWVNRNRVRIGVLQRRRADPSLDSSSSSAGLGPRRARGIAGATGRPRGGRSARGPVWCKARASATVQFRPTPPDPSVCVLRSIHGGWADSSVTLDPGSPLALARSCCPEMATKFIALPGLTATRV